MVSTEGLPSGILPTALQALRAWHWPLFGSFARAAGLRLHVAAPGVLPAADMMEDAARAVGSALREALQPVAS